MTHIGQGKGPKLDSCLIEEKAQLHGSVTLSHPLEWPGSLFPQAFRHAAQFVSDVLPPFLVAWFTPTHPNDLSRTAPLFLEEENMAF